MKLSNAWFIADLAFDLAWSHVFGLFWGTNVTLLPAPCLLHCQFLFFIPATDSWYLCMFHYLLVTAKLTLIALHIRPPLLVSLGINLLHSCSWEHVRHCLPSVWPVMPRCGPRSEEWSVLCSLIFPVHGLYWIILYMWGTHLICFSYPPDAHSHNLLLLSTFPPYTHWLLHCLWIFPPMCANFTWKYIQHPDFEVYGPVSALTWSVLYLYNWEFIII